MTHTSNLDHPVAGLLTIIQQLPPHSFHIGKKHLLLPPFASAYRTFLRNVTGCRTKMWHISQAYWGLRTCPSHAYCQRQQGRPPNIHMRYTNTYSRGSHGCYVTSASVHLSKPRTTAPIHCSIAPFSVSSKFSGLYLSSSWLL